MGIRRSALEFEERFTRIPNDWARDARMSRRARGLLVEIMSHRVGWHVTIRSLAATGKEGRDAIQTALNELLEFGYVRRMQGRAAAGKFGEIEYELCDPETVAGFPVRGSAVSGSTVSGESAHKEDHSSEDHSSEDDPSESDVASDVLPAMYDDKIIELCNRLAEAVRANGHKVGAVGKTWWSACDRLVRLDGYSLEQIDWMIRWATSNEFWAANIRSMPTLREKFSTLVLQAKREATMQQGPTSRANSVVEMGRRLAEAGVGR
jgi:hypothetical protein